jgi:hypothetical protein
LKTFPQFSTINATSNSTKRYQTVDDDESVSEDSIFQQSCTQPSNNSVVFTDNEDGDKNMSSNVDDSCETDDSLLREEIPPKNSNFRLSSNIPIPSYNIDIPKSGKFEDLHDPCIPTEIKDFASAVSEIEGLRRRQQTLLSNVQDLKAENQLLQVKYQSMQVRIPFIFPS